MLRRARHPCSGTSAIRRIADGITAPCVSKSLLSLLQRQTLALLNEITNNSSPPQPTYSTLHILSSVSTYGILRENFSCIATMASIFTWASKGSELCLGDTDGSASLTPLPAMRLMEFHHVHHQLMLSTGNNTENNASSHPQVPFRHSFLHLYPEIKL